MTFTKINHSTLILDYKNTKVLFDPGNYTFEEVQNLLNIDLLIITHNHSDHLHIPSVEILMANNPDSHIITNSEVSKILLTELHLETEICENGQQTTFKDIVIKSFDIPHVEIWKDITLPQNTAYLLDEAFYNPGDSLTVVTDIFPEVCVFMITGPATTVASALEYGLKQNFKTGIGVHDGMLNRIMANHKLPEKYLNSSSKKYFNLGKGESITL